MFGTRAQSRPLTILRPARRNLTTLLRPVCTRALIRAEPARRTIGRLAAVITRRFAHGSSRPRAASPASFRADASHELHSHAPCPSFFRPAIWGSRDFGETPVRRRYQGPWASMLEEVVSDETSSTRWFWRLSYCDAGSTCPAVAAKPIEIWGNSLLATVVVLAQKFFLAEERINGFHGRRWPSVSLSSDPRSSGAA